MVAIKIDIKAKILTISFSVLICSKAPIITMLEIAFVTAVTNAISSIVIIGALLQMRTENDIVSILALISIFIATINIVGGFMVTKRMLSMFQRS